VLKSWVGVYRQIFKIDAYDERFLSSSVVTFGVEKFAGGIRRIFKIDRG